MNNPTPRHAPFTRIAAFCAGAALTSLGAVAVAASPMSAPRPAQAHPAPSPAVATDEAPPTMRTATAVVVKSWGGCSSDGLLWEALNRDWQQLGEVRVHIDYRNSALCDGSTQVTYDALTASGAQTVILSDIAGGEHSLDASEIDAITRYVQEGHNVIATYLTLEYRRFDNRGLAPLFGLDSTVTYGWRNYVRGSYRTAKNARLFYGVGEYSTEGLRASQLPSGDYWTNDAAGDAHVIATGTSRRSAILQYCGSTFRAILFTEMPELGGGAQDERVLYNAVVMGRRAGCNEG